jgi:hypothetical protein
MNEPLGSPIPTAPLQPLIPARPSAKRRPRLELSVATPGPRHSVVATAFLTFYVAIYLAIGFLGISLIGRAWATVFE